MPRLTVVRYGIENRLLISRSDHEEDILNNNFFLPQIFFEQRNNA